MNPAGASSHQLSLQGSRSRRQAPSPSLRMPTISLGFNEKRSLSGLPLPNGLGYSGDRSRRPSTGDLRSLLRKGGRGRNLLLVVVVLVIFVFTFGKGGSSSEVSPGLNDSKSWFGNVGEGSQLSSAGRKGPRLRPPKGAEGIDQPNHFDDDDESLIADDDRAVDRAVEANSLSEEEQEAERLEAENNAQREKQERKEQLRTLVWFLAQDGELPPSYDVPSSEELVALGPRGFRQELVNADPQIKSAFKRGWEEHADVMLRVTVFSKSYCPYSRNAKNILLAYHLLPHPNIVELDQRPDMSQLQDLLLHLTGRRTVPNVLLDFESLGGSDEIQLLHTEGTLKKQLIAMAHGDGQGNAAYPPPDERGPAPPLDDNADGDYYAEDGDGYEAPEPHRYGDQRRGTEDAEMEYDIYEPNP